MTAILGGLAAAGCWAVSVLCSSRSSRRLEPMTVVAWMMLVGLLISGPLAAARGAPHHVAPAGWLWFALAGAGNVTGLVIAYRALQQSTVALVAPVTSTEGAIAAVIAILAGEPVSVPVMLALAVVAVGVCLSSVPADPPGSTGRGTHMRAVWLAGAAALCYGVSLYATGRASAVLPEAWVVLSARAFGVAFLVLPLAARGRLASPRPAVALIVASGVAEVAGFYAYAWGARHGIAIASVLASQFAAITIIVAWLLFKERLGRLQLAGVLLLIIGVSALSALRG